MRKAIRIASGIVTAFVLWVLLYLFTVALIDQPLANWMAAVFAVNHTFMAGVMIYQEVRGK